VSFVGESLGHILRLVLIFYGTPSPFRHYPPVMSWEVVDAYRGMLVTLFAGLAVIFLVRENGKSRS
jgi:hypothetical protein